MKILNPFLIALVALMVSCVTNPNTTPNTTSNAVSNAVSECCSTSSIDTPAKAIAALQAGNKRFVEGVMSHPNSDEKRRGETLNSQSPYAVVVACSDSRVPVELLFDQGIGDLFVIRTAGNSVADDTVMGSVDYAVDHLNTPLVVILGHQNCGGITATIASQEENEGHHHHKHKGKIAELIASLRRDVEQHVGKPEQLDEAIRCNADAQVERIKSVDYIKERIEAGELQVVSAYYNLDSGKVDFNN